MAYYFPRINERVRDRSSGRIGRVAEVTKSGAFIVFEYGSAYLAFDRLERVDG